MEYRILEFRLNFKHEHLWEKYLMGKMCLQNPAIFPFTEYTVGASVIFLFSG